MGKMYLGTYTSGASEGIYYVTNGHAELVAKLKDASWLLKTGDGYLLSVSELAGDNGETQGEMYAYRMEADGTLTETSHIGTGGLAPCHIAWDAHLRRGVVSNYLSGNIEMFSLDGDGMLKVIEVIPLNAPGQAPGHAHCAVFSHAGDRFYVCDLGLNQVIVRNMTTELRRYTLPKGLGPRHAVLSEDEKALFVLCELGCEALALNLENGALIWRQPLRDQGYDGFAAAAAIRLHPKGREIAVSLRGNAKVILFGMDAHSGITWRKDHRMTDALPRDIAFSQDGKTLYVAFQDGEKVLSYTHDEEGTLEINGHIDCPNTVSICV